VEKALAYQQKIVLITMVKSFRAEATIRNDIIQTVFPFCEEKRENFGSLL
jgi:hypothetical protein